MAVDRLGAKAILAALQEWGVTHLIGIPDNSSASLFDLAGLADSIQILTVTREAEAFAIAAGLWIGGKRPVVLIQNTGFLESGDSFRGTVMRMRIPLLCLITYRGYAKMKAKGLDPVAAPPDKRFLSRTETDSAALMLEPTLRAWGLSYGFLFSNHELEKISQSLQEAKQESRPVALLIPGVISPE